MKSKIVILVIVAFEFCANDAEYAMVQIKCSNARAHTKSNKLKLYI